MGVINRLVSGFIGTGEGGDWFLVTRMKAFIPTVKMGSVGFPETSSPNLFPTQSNSPENRRLQTFTAEA